jgi:K(+)-stimulated pyrophosphate-energized sodium pump
MVIAGLGLIFSIVGASFVKIKKKPTAYKKRLNIGNWMSIVLNSYCYFFVVQWMLPADSFLYLTRDLKMQRAH